MPRRPLIRSAEYPYHVYGRSNNKDWFKLPLSDIWTICLKNFDVVNRRYGLIVHAFVLMNNHYHLLARTPRANLGEVMNYWAREVSRSIARKTNRVNHIFGGRYKWCIIDNQRYYDHVYRYVYRNPIESKLCEKIELYPFSTWTYLLNKNVPRWMSDQMYMDLSCQIPPLFDERTHWINKPYDDPKQKEIIRKGLRRSHFTYSTESRYQKTIKIMDGLY